MHVKVSSPYVKAYHHNQNLLFQFILYEFMTTYHKTRYLQQLAQDVKSQENLDPIETLLHKLIGPGQDLRLLPWNFDGGVLIKLKNYCDLYAQYAQGQAVKLHQNVSHVWLCCQEGIDVLRHLRLGHSLQKNLTLLLRIITKIQRIMQKIARLIAQIIKQFHRDESVVFFLLRHHKRFEELYNIRFISALLSKMYPKGVKDAEKFLIQKYRDKGFPHLIPTISEKIYELQPSSHES